MKIYGISLFNSIKKHFYILNSDVRFSEIFSGAIWVFLANIIGAGLLLVINIILARNFGAKVLGIITIIESVLILVTIFTVFGTDTSLMRLIPEHTIKHSVSSAYSVYHKAQYSVIIVSIIIGTLLFLVSDDVANNIFSKPYLTSFIKLSAIFAVFKALVLLNTEAVRGLKLIKAFAYLKIIPHLIYLFLLVVVANFYHFENGPIYSFFTSITITGLIGWGVMEIAFKRRMHPDDRVMAMPIRNLISISLPMFMNTAISFIMAQTGIIMLGMFRSDAEVGYYGISVKLAALTILVLASVNSMIAPKFAEYSVLNEMDNLFYIAKKATKLIFWSTTPIIVLLLLFGKNILLYFFGHEFVSAFPALAILLVGQFINCISGSTACFMNMTGNQNILRNILLFSIGINISLNYFLVPIHGVIGAAIASMASVSFWNIATLCFIASKYKNTTAYFPFVGKILIYQASILKN